MTTQPIQNTTPTPSSSTKGTGPTLGKDDFLKLLVGQLQNQDPMQPTDDQSWITEMAQFSQVEQTANVADSTNKILSSLDATRALSLIGHKVAYSDASGNAQMGVVDRIELSASGSATLDVSGQSGIATTAVSEVE